MADRFPLIVDSSTQRVKELASGDNLDLTGSGIVADAFTVDTNSEPRLRITNSGNLGIGSITSPLRRVHFEGSLDVENSGYIRYSAAGYPDQYVWDVGRDNATNGGSFKVDYKGTGSQTTYLTIDSSGDITATGAATFDGKLQSKNSSDIAELASGTNTGFRLLENGTDANVVMGWDGSATFAGNIDLTDSTVDLYSQTTNSASKTFQLFSDIGGTKVEKVAITANGSGTFSGPVYSGGYTNGSQTEALAAQISTSHTVGLLIGSTSSSLNANTAIQVKNSGGTEVVDIRADGSAAFTGSVESSNGNGRAFLGASTTSGIAVQNSGNSTVTSLNYDGSASFAGTTIVGSDPDVTSNSGCKLFASGTIRARSTSSTSSGILFEGFGAGQSSSQFKVTADGSASFIGAMGVGTTPQDNIGKVFITESPAVTGKTLLALGDGNAVNGKLKSDGSAEFAGAVDVGTFSAGTSGIRLTNTGTIYIGGTGNNAGLSIGNSAAVIDYDGSATFADDVTIGKTTSGASDIGARFITGSSSQLLTLDCVGGGSSDVAYQINNDGSATYQVKADGSATFANKAVVGTQVAGNNYSVQDLGKVMAYRSTTSSDAVWNGGGGSTTTSTIDANGSATFAGTMEARNIDGKRPAGSTSDVFAGFAGTSATSRIFANGNATFNGAVSKGSGSFRINHPLKPETHHLVHSFVEGPQADNIYRGKVDLVDGTATVNIDTVAGMTEGTFAALNREIQCFTTNETGWTAIKGSVTGNLLTIVAQDDTCTDTISWLVIGERQDQHMYDTEWTDENGKVIVEPEKEVTTESETE
jgi:hypothetical protein